MHASTSRRLAAGLGCLTALLAWTAPAARAQDGARVRIPVEQYRLSNGLEVLLSEDHSAPIVFVNVTYHVGSGNETPGKSGFAHLFEHMMFQGSVHVPEDQHFAILKAIGGRGFNGTTNTDRTNYFESVPAHQLETALWLESDRMGYLLPMLTQRSFDNQRDVVRNERRMNFENVAYAQERFAIGLELYPEGHPYRNLVIGLHEDLERASLDDVRAFFEKWYVPANATLLIAGDIDVPATKGLVEKWFGTFPRSVRPAASTPAAPVLAGVSRKTFTDALAPLRRIHYVWPSPAMFAPGDAELQLVAAVLGSTTGRLRKALILDRGIARSVGAFQSGRGFSGEFHLLVDLAPDVTIEGVENILKTEIVRMRTQLVGARELKQALAGLVASYARDLEPLAARGQQLQLYAHYLGKADHTEADLDRYRKATPEAIRAAAEKFLTEKRIEIITLPPGTAAAQTGGR